MAQNVYIHIPFCKQKCKYCSFVSFPKLDDKEKYIGALCDEIKNGYRGEQLKTLYFGGGTPSLLTIEEFDRVLGGGIVPGSLTLVGGDPGIGKSTLLLQVCKELSDFGREVLYISGEESLSQIKMRADRIGMFQDKFKLLTEINLNVIAETVKSKKYKEIKNCRKVQMFTVWRESCKIENRVALMAQKRG